MIGWAKEFHWLLFLANARQLRRCTLKQRLGLGVTVVHMYDYYGSIFLIILHSRTVAFSERFIGVIFGQIYQLSLL